MLWTEQNLSQFQLYPSAFCHLFPHDRIYSFSLPNSQPPSENEIRITLQVISSPNPPPFHLPTFSFRPFPHQNRPCIRSPVNAPPPPPGVHYSWFNLLPSRSTHNLKLKVAFVGPFLLHHAVSLHDINTVRSIIKRQRSLVAALSTQETYSLYDAAAKSGRNGYNDMLNLLVEAGLKIGTRTTDGLVHDGKLASKGWTELHAAVAFNRTDEMERIARTKEHGSSDCRDKEGRTPLHLAASKWHKHKQATDVYVYRLHVGRSEPDLSTGQKHKQVTDVYLGVSTQPIPTTQ